MFKYHVDGLMCDIIDYHKFLRGDMWYDCETRTLVEKFELDENDDPYRWISYDQWYDKDLNYYAQFYITNNRQEIIAITSYWAE